MANETVLTVVGNLTDDLELKVSSAGVSWVSFTVASTPRMFDQSTGKWRDGTALFMRCTAFRDMAENVAESLTKGSRVVVTGKLRQTEWKTAEGEKRQGFQLDVEEIGASLRYARAKVLKLTRSTVAEASTSSDPWANQPADDAPPF